MKAINPRRAIHALNAVTKGLDNAFTNHTVASVTILGGIIGAGAGCFIQPHFFQNNLICGLGGAAITFCISQSSFGTTYTP